MSADGIPAAPLRAVVEELVRGGVRDVVICPGSRSTPMALALHAAAGLRTWVHLDERAGAFFALGAARASRRPVAVLATSGTAVVEFAPAVVEARYGRVPLILLTADRPPELQGIGAPQAIDQVELYGRHAKWYAELPVPDEAPESEVEVRTTVARALEVATAAPSGPVQLNLPYREPLLPLGPLAVDAAPAPDDGLPETPTPPAELVEPLVRAARAAARPLVVCGPIDRPGFATAAASLAAALRAPLVADVLANLRTGQHERGHVIAHHEAVLRVDRFREGHVPDLVVRFGATPTSKLLTRWLEQLPTPQLLVDDGGGWNRPRGGAIRRVDAAPVAFASAAAAAVARESSADPAWLDAWLAADARAADALARWFERLDEPFEGAVARALTTAIDGEALVVAGNSMPVRDLDAFTPGAKSDLRFVGNRGANGIDGLLSTTLGAAAVQPRPVIGVVGDLSLLHDLTALAAGVRLGLDATFVLVDNDGGGIFSFLPQASADRPEAGLPGGFETLFGTPHGLDLGPLVSALGARHVPVDATTLTTELRAAVGRAGVDVLHLRTERARNVELHQAAQASVARALERLP